MPVSVHRSTLSFRGRTLLNLFTSPTSYLSTIFLPLIPPPYHHRCGVPLHPHKMTTTSTQITRWPSSTNRKSCPRVNYRQCTSARSTSVVAWKPVSTTATSDPLNSAKRTCTIRPSPSSTVPPRHWPRSEGT